MRNLMKFGMVLVVLAMVTSVAFARTQEYEGPQPPVPPEEVPDPSWCNDDNWSNETPRDGKKDDVVIDNGNTVVIDCEPAEIDELIIIDGGVQVGTASVNVYLRCDGDLEMADKKSSNYAILNIVNGYMYVEDQCKDLFEDGSGEITVAAGSTLVLDDGVYLGDSSDGGDSVYTFNIAGDLEINGDRLEHRGGQLIVNQTGGSFYVKKTTRLAMAGDSVATFTISGGTVELDKVELNHGVDDFDYSLAINLSGDGKWDGSGEEMRDGDDGVIVNIDITGGSFVTKKLDIDNDDSELNITMSGGTFDIEDDMELNAGDIEITGGEFNVEDDFKLGDDGVATLTISGTADVWIDDLYMNDDSELTINGVRMDIDDLKEDKGSIEINGAGSLVIKNADDQDDLDDINDMIDDGDITTTSPGMYIVADYDVTNDDRLTIQAVYPFEVDILPGGCPNPLRINFQGSGVYPVAIVGSDTFDVTTVDVGTITLIGVPVHRTAIGDVSTAGDVCDGGPDGTPDLILKFRRDAIMAALEARLPLKVNGDPGVFADLPNEGRLELLLLAKTNDGDTVGGIDELTVINRDKIKRRK